MLQTTSYTMKIFIAVIAFISINAYGQPVSYDDVGVIVNDNSQTSIDIANYFQAARNIPAQNMIHISAPTTEDIDSLQFQQIRAQIESYLITNSLVDSLNYLVTTKGVPLKLYNYSSCVQSPVPGMSCGSFDSDLALILGSLSWGIGSQGMVPNPYYSLDENFSRDSVGIYLVTRLDGYTKEDVFNLIDNSGPNIGLDQQYDQAILDLNNTIGGGDSAYFADMVLQPAFDTLTGNYWNATVDYYEPALTNQNDVFAYMATGHGPFSGANLNYTWTQGAFGSLSTCNTAETFDATLNTANNFFLADLIAQGCTAAHGHVNCIYFTQVLNFDILVDRYLDPNKNYNLAESYYMSERTLSWQTVIIGDPKASVYIDNPASIKPIEKDVLRLYPNPTNDSFKIYGLNQVSGIKSVTIVGVDGALVKSIEGIEHGESLSIEEPGIYFVTVFSDGNLIGTYKVINQ
jgi:uncharacterized protein (TIGR03790 family)